MKTKTKILLSAILAVAFCVSMIAGATLAIFTSNDSVSIAVNSGKVKVDATVAVADVYSPTSINKDTLLITDDTDIAGAVTTTDGVSTGYFNHSGKSGNAYLESDSYASADDGVITLKNMAPGDKVVLSLTINSKSNVSYKWRFSLTSADTTQSALLDQLLIGMKDTADTDYTYYSAYTTAYELHTAATDATNGEDILSASVVIEMPVGVGNSYRDLSCNLLAKVDAVQGNADTSSYASDVKKVYRVSTESALSTALTNIKDGETIYLDAAKDSSGKYTNPWESTTVNISYTDTKTIILRGYDIGTLNVNALNGTVHVYNNVTNIGGSDSNGVVVAGESLHIYGNVGNLTLSQGHVVLEQGSSITGTATVAATADQTASLEIAEEVAVTALTVNTENSAPIVKNKGIITTLSVLGNNSATISNIIYGDGENDKGQILNQSSFGEGVITEEKTIEKMVDFLNAKLDNLTLTSDASGRISVLKTVEAAKIDVADLIPSENGYYFVWDETLKKFGVVAENNLAKVVYPSNITAASSELVYIANQGMTLDASMTKIYFNNWSTIVKSDVSELADSLVSVEFGNGVNYIGNEDDAFSIDASNYLMFNGSRSVYSQCNKNSIKYLDTGDNINCSETWPELNFKYIDGKCQLVYNDEPVCASSADVYGALYKIDGDELKNRLTYFQNESIFKEFSKVTSVYIGQNIKFMGYGLFEQCQSMSYIYYNAEYALFPINNNGTAPFSLCGSETSQITLEIGDDATNVPNLFVGQGSNKGENVNKVIFENPENSVCATIERKAFVGMAITEITLPKNLSVINGSSADGAPFYECDNLTSIKWYSNEVIAYKNDGSSTKISSVDAFTSYMKVQGSYSVIKEISIEVIE